MRNRSMRTERAAQAFRYCFVVTLLITVLNLYHQFMVIDKNIATNYMNYSHEDGIGNSAHDKIIETFDPSGFVGKTLNSGGNSTMNNTNDESSENDFDDNYNDQNINHNEDNSTETNGNTTVVVVVDDDNNDDNENNNDSEGSSIEKNGTVVGKIINSTDIIDENKSMEEIASQETLTGAVQEKKTKNTSIDQGNPFLQPLECTKFGGPSIDIASEMVYWMKIPSDETYMNQFQKAQEKEDEKFLIFEPDGAGWNNIRMSLETIITLAISMGRTIVLPPEKRIYLLWDSKNGNQKHHFKFRDFFKLEEAEAEHKHLKFISMEEYLNRFGMNGLLRDTQSRNMTFPPQNRTNWDQSPEHIQKKMWQYIQSTSYAATSWKPMDSFSYFPAYNTDLGPERRKQIKDIVNNMTFPIVAQYQKNPTPVDAPVTERLREHLARRRLINFYDNEMQKQKFIHFKHDFKTGDRFLLPFYTYHFFEDWKQALWTKRFVRDHLRYNDELMCAAARVVGELREKAKKYDPDNTDGRFNTMHIRRGDFHLQYKGSISTAEDLLEISKDKMLNVSKTVFIATDEKNSTYFSPFHNDYQVFFLKNFSHLLQDVNSNYYPLIDQLICTRGDIFYGTHFSTFTSYINRLRGYYSWRDKTDGYEEGKIHSYYFNPPHVVNKYQNYVAIQNPLWAYEFTEAWYDIDKDVYSNDM